MPRFPRARHIVVVVATVLVAVPIMVAALTAPATAGAPGSNAPVNRAAITVGSLTLAPCKTSKLAWCTTTKVPLDYADPTAPKISIYLEWYPALVKPTNGTILATEGGPGYPTTGSRDDYRALFGPLLNTRNLVMVDLRGTGNSTVIKCPGVQHWTEVRNTDQQYINDAGACGRQLDHTWKRADGSYVAASDLFTTANAARDVDRLLGELHTGKVDFYGDSYGTFFGQTLTARFPGDLRSVTLDAAYPVQGENPFYPDITGAAEHAFNISCARSVACSTAALGSSWTRIGYLAARLRKGAITGSTRTPDGAKVTETVGINQLIELVNDAGADSGVYHDLDPAIRVLLDHGDAKPLLRLAAQEIDTSNSGPYKEFSAGLYTATSCADYPQPFPYTESVRKREAGFAAAVAALPAKTFAPFTVTEWVTEPEEEFDACEKWPAPANPEPPVATPPPFAPADLPVLVLTGDLDSLTTPAEGRAVAADMGSSARWILVHNSTHVTALDDPIGCASGIVTRFIAHPGALQTMDATCAARTPEVRVTGSYPTTLGKVMAATATAGNKASKISLRLAAVGAAAVGDAQWRWFYMAGDDGVGLRGGTYTFGSKGSDTTIAFDKVKWTNDTTVSGTARWNQTTGKVTATVTITGPGGASASVKLSYADYKVHSTAKLNGTAGGKAIRATMPAP